jgi:hypothetical protein
MQFTSPCAILGSKATLLYNGCGTVISRQGGGPWSRIADWRVYVNRLSFWASSGSARVLRCMYNVQYMRDCRWRGSFVIGLSCELALGWR